MKCPSCGYENEAEALWCNLCQFVFGKEAPKAPPPAPAAEKPAQRPPAAQPAAGQPSDEEPRTLDSEETIERVVKLALGKGIQAEAMGDMEALRGEVPRLAGRLFLELEPETYIQRVLAPTADAWLRLTVPAFLDSGKNAEVRALLDRMLEAARARRFGEALELLQAADRTAGPSKWAGLLILGLGLKRACAQTEPRRAAAAAVPPPAPARAAPIRKGDVLAQKYEIHRVLGEGGFGIVYLAFHRPSQTVLALKTFKEEFFDDRETRDLFRKEAQILVDLDAHPHLLRAYLVDEVHGRLFIGLEYVAPDENGINTLEGHLRLRPPDLAQSLRWAVQFCHGMEFAAAKGLRCHRDIKPANIMIDARGRLMISDFGLAGALRLLSEPGKGAAAPAATGGQDGRTARGVSFGTPTYMSPEQFIGAHLCDARSDVYSFGVVLFQLASRGSLPFLTEDRKGFWTEMRRLQSVVEPPRLDSPLFPIIERCLQKNPRIRYQTFAELRKDLEALLKKTTGEEAPAPRVEAREDADWDAKGLSLRALGRYDEAVACFDKALAMRPSGQSWNNKGAACVSLQRYEEALQCFDKSVSLQDRAAPRLNKAGVLLRLGRKEEALACVDAALRLEPRNCAAWTNKGSILHGLGRHQEAGQAFDKALGLDRTCEDAWGSKVAALLELGQVDAALAAADKCLSINPGSALGWTNKGYCLQAMKRHPEALSCFERALVLDASLVNAWGGKRASCKALGRAADVMAALDKELELDPENGPTWLDKGKELGEAKRWEEALPCLEKAARLEPKWPFAWTNLAFCLMSMGRIDEAQAAYGKALAVDPGHVTAALTRGDLLCKLSRYEEAIPCLDVVLTAGPGKAQPAYIGAAAFRKGECLHRLGRRPEAQACYAQALQSLPAAAHGAVQAALRALQQGLPPP